MIRAIAALSLVALGSCRCAGSTKTTEPAPSGHAPSVADATGSDGGSATPAGGQLDAAVDAARSKEPGLEPLSAPGPLIHLAVEGFRNAIVSVPHGTTRPRPVLVALHGNYDRPEWQCDVWRDITAGFPFILCPRGIPRGDAPNADRWTYGGLGATQKELEAGLDALGAAYPEYVAEGPVLFTGFSLGAILGVHIIKKNPERYPRAVLTEGGYKGWSLGVARSYAKGGAARVLFACGQTACKHAARQPARFLEKESVPSKVVYNGNAGHTYDGKVADAIVEQWDWLVEGDARWAVRPGE